MKKSRLLGALSACVFAMAIPSPVSAILIISGDGTETCTQGPALGSGPCDVQTINPATVWQPNNPDGNGALWISYADTGRPGTVTAPPGFVATFTETFSTNIGDVLDLSVWADNTAAVLIDGITLISANFTSDAYCADGPIGCEVGEPGVMPAARNSSEFSPSMWSISTSSAPRAFRAFMPSSNSARSWK